MFPYRFRDKKEKNLELQDALYLLHITDAVILRYRNNKDFQPDSDDFFLLSQIILAATDVVERTTELEAFLRQK